MLALNKWHSFEWSAEDNLSTLGIISGLSLALA